MPNMTSQLSSSIPTTNLNPSFGSRGTTPPYGPFPFGGGHIPQMNPTVGGWNPLSILHPLFLHANSEECIYYGESPYVL
jgi:hypothetical protein